MLSQSALQVAREWEALPEPMKSQIFSLIRSMSELQQTPAVDAPVRVGLRVPPKGKPN